MKQHIVRYALGFVVLLALLGHAAKFYQFGFINRLDAIIYDTKVRLTMPQSVDERVVILDIDEKSLGEIGRWPWGRDRVSQLVTKLFDQHGIALLGLDVVFAEPDESSGLKVLERLAKGDLKDSTQFQSALKELRPQLDHDGLFAETLKGRPVILGYYLSGRSDGVSSGALPPPVLPEGSFPRDATSPSPFGPIMEAIWPSSRRRRYQAGTSTHWSTSTAFRVGCRSWPSTRANTTKHSHWPWCGP
ncbi:MAG: CHASE2 domain-containing protein [Rhodocyclaceae bacterium]|nr:CHASE2 domain-containing protein [Rhodocyclaceae bacterium]